MIRLLLLLVLSLSTALGQTPEKTPDKVSLQLQWLDQFQFAGYYMAIEKGFYKKAGLDVTLKPFKVGLEPTEEVLGGRADYGTGRSTLLIDRTEGKPVVALAAIFQSSPNVLLARKDSGIRTVTDFRGKRIMLTRDAQDSITYQAMLNAEGLTFNDVTRLEHSFNLNDLIDKKTDLMACYTSNEPFRMKERGVETVGFTPKSYGFDFYSDILFTSEKELQQHPERVEAFLKASIEGWHYAFEHIEETVEIIMHRYNTQHKSRESLIFEANTLKRLAFDGKVPLGHIALEKFKTVYDLYRVMGITPKPLENIDGFIYRSAINAPLELTPEEKRFLRLHTLRAITAGYGPPFKHSAAIHNGFPLTAVAYDLWMRIVERHDIATYLDHGPSSDAILEAVANRDADVALSIDSADTPNLLWSKPYGEFTYVIVTRDTPAFIPDLTAMKGKKVALRRSSYVFKRLSEQMPDIETLPVDSSDESLELLARGDVDAVIELLPIVSHVTEYKQYDNIRVSGTTPFRQPLRFAVRSDYPELLSILNKSIDAMDVQERNQIFNRYLSPPPSTQVDYKLVTQILIAVMIVVFILLYRQYLLKRHNSALLKMASTDKLTQIANRLQLDRSLNELVTRYRRYRRDFSVILLDIDNFKNVNDRYGHLAGDRALQALTDLLKRHLRDTDLLGRWGGEEFLILCQETDMQGARMLAEALLTIIDHEQIDGIGHLSCSFGVTGIQEGDTPDTLLLRVDDALYRAKRSGRDQVAFL